ncbi:T9SS type A sorting domain-containing protein [Bacteroidota bacterium]
MTIYTSNTHRDAYLSIFSLDGRLIIKQTLNSKEETVSTRNLPNGMYFVSITLNNSYLMNKKIIIEH